MSASDPIVNPKLKWVKIVALLAMVGGFGVEIIALFSKNKSLFSTGLTLFLLGLTAYLAAWYFSRSK